MKNKMWITTQKGMVEIFLDNANVIPFTFSLDAFTKTSSNGGSLRAYFSSTLSLPMNGVNCKALSIMPDNAVQAVRELLAESPTVLLESGPLTFRGVLNWFGAQKTDGVNTIEVQFLGSSINFFSQIPKYLCQLSPFGCHTFSTSAITANFANVGPWDGNKAPYYYSLKNWGNIEGDYVSLSQLRPDCHLAAILQQIEIYTGVRIVSQFFKTEFFRNLLVGIYDYKGTPQIEMFSGVLNADYLPQATGNFPFNQPDGPHDWTLSDPYSLHDNSNASIRILTSSQRVQMTVKINAITEDGAGTNTNIFRLRTGTQGTILDSFTTTGGGTYDFELSAIVPSGGLVSLAWSGQGIVKAGTTFSVCLSSENAPIENAEVCCNDFFGNDLKTIDLITACIEKYNLKIMYDTKNEELIIEPSNDYFITVTGESGQGFFKASSTPTDLTGKIDCSKSEFDFTVEDVNRTLIYKFADDDKDQTTDGETFADTRILNTKFKDETTELSNKFFSPTTDDFLPSLPAINPNEIVVPTMRAYDINDLESEPKNSYDWKPRIFYKVGLVDGAWNFGTSINGFVTLPQYPKVTQVDAALNINLGYADADGVPGLTSIFRYKDLDIFNFGMVRRFDVLLKVTDLMCLEDLFRHLAWVGVKGSEGRHIVQSIQMNLGEEKASIELITYDI